MLLFWEIFEGSNFVREAHGIETDTFPACDVGLNHVFTKRLLKWQESTQAKVEWDDIGLHPLFPICHFSSPGQLCKQCCGEQRWCNVFVRLPASKARWELDENHLNDRSSLQ